MQHSSKPPASDRPGSDRSESNGSRIPVATVHSPVMASVLVQLVATLCLSLAVGIVHNWLWAAMLSVWVGGGVAAAVTVFAAWRALWRRRDEHRAEMLLVQLYGAELGKLLFAGLLLGLSLKYLPWLSAAWIIAGFALAYVAGAVSMAATGFKLRGKMPE